MPRAESLGSVVGRVLRGCLVDGSTRDAGRIAEHLRSLAQRWRRETDPFAVVAIRGANELARAIEGALKRLDTVSNASETH